MKTTRQTFVALATLFVVACGAAFTDDGPTRAASELPANTIHVPSLGTPPEGS